MAYSESDIPGQHDAHIKHLNREWNAAKWPKKGNDMQARIYRNIFDLLMTFSEENHSGTTAPYTIDLFSKLALFKPIVPLTGEDDEWIEVGEGVYQNRRCSNIFKEKGEAYNIEGKIFVESGGGSYTNKDSRVVIKEFPHTPTSEYITVADF